MDQLDTLQINSDMVMDTDYDEKQDVAIISPADSMDEADAEPEIRADDFEAMKKRHMPLTTDLEVETEATNTWDIDNWRTLGKRIQGPIFHSGDHPWRVLFFPQGNNVDHASFYLEHGFDGNVPDDWYACAQFMLTLWNPNDPTIYVTHTATHRFNGDEADWGFTRFAELRKIFAARFEDHDRPLVENNSAKLTAFVRVYRDPTGVLWHNFINYDSKKQTGMVGLKNQGATCYLNSLLQSLYFTNAFRKAVYMIPTEDETDVRTNSAYALQRLFYQLQTSTLAVSTNELTKAFGWDTRQIFEQQDVQELSRVLMERLEEKMKGTEAQDALPKMFIGKTKTYISCINVDYESSRIEDFWDIQLNVSGNKDLDASFKDYIAEETMDGENKYFAEGFGLQDARKGVIFESFPAVLHLQLKRFEYDFNRDTMMKINDSYEFPEVWDAAPYLSKDADKSEPYNYKLHGVLVHSGDLNAGHYYAFLKPEKDGAWFKFDDDRVMRALPREAISENFGGELPPLANGTTQQRNPYTRTWNTKRSNNAYMLVYIRESRLDQILMDDAQIPPPEHLAIKFAEEKAQTEKARRDREEAHLYMEVHVATDQNFKVFQGFDIVPWKGDVPPETVPKTYRLLKTTAISEFVKIVAETAGVNHKFLRPWAMVNRQNGTVRPDKPIPEFDITLQEAADKYGTKSAQFRLWMETADDKDKEGNPVFGDSLVETGGNIQNRAIVLFLKHFDIEKQTLYGAGHFYASQQEKAGDIAPHILKLMGWPVGTNFKMYEEIKHNMIEPIKGKQTLAVSEIQDGDIITVQKVYPDKEAQAFTDAGKFVDARDFYDNLLHKIKVKFEAKYEGDGPSFELELSKRMNYGTLTARIAEALGAKVDPTHLRISPVNASNGRAKNALKPNTPNTLGSILQPGYNNYGSSMGQRPDCLYYEILEVSVAELENMKSLKVTWLTEGVAKEEPYEILVPKNGTVDDMVMGLQRKLGKAKDGLPDELLPRIRVYEVHASKIFRECAPNYAVANLTEFVQLLAEVVPEGEMHGEYEEHEERPIHVVHFDKELTKMHGTPFIFMIKKGEVFSDTKERFSKKTGIKGKGLERIKFASVVKGYGKPEYISDDDILWEKIPHPDGMLACDHTNKQRSVWSRADSIFIR